MRMRFLAPAIYLSCFFICLMALTPLYAGTTTLVTYYPAPSGNYNKMTINSSLTFSGGGTNGCVSQTSPLVVLANNSGKLELCDNGGTINLTSAGIEAGSSGNVAITGNEVITGNLTVNGDTILGVPGGSHTTTINGNASITGSLTFAGGANPGAATGTSCKPEGTFAYDITNHVPVYCSSTLVWTSYGSTYQYGGEYVWNPYAHQCIMGNAFISTLLNSPCDCPSGFTNKSYIVKIPPDLVFQSTNAEVHICTKGNVYSAYTN